MSRAIILIVVVGAILNPLETKRISNNVIDFVHHTFYSVVAK